MAAEPSSNRCGSCGVEVAGRPERCPSCHRRFVTSTQVRVSGVLLSVIGAALSVAMAYLLVVVAQAMRPSGSAARGAFTGTPRDATLIFAILGGVLALGVTSLVTGVWQVTVGRRSLLLSALVLVLGLVVAALAILFLPQGQ